MSKQSDWLLAESLARRWQFSSQPATGATCQGSVQAAHPNAMMHVTSFAYSVVNQTAAAVFPKFTIRDGSVAGNVLAQIALAVPVNGSTQFNGALDVVSSRGTGTPPAIYADFTGFASSVTQTLSVCGWEEEYR